VTTRRALSAPTWRRDARFLHRRDDAGVRRRRGLHRHDWAGGADRV